MTHPPRSSLILLGAMLGAVRAAAAQSPPPAKFSSAADSLQKLVTSGFMPSVAFSVVNGSGTIYEGAFGYADRERRVRATPRTAYPVASVAKSYTAIGALRAIDARRIDLDARANQYLGTDSIEVPVGDPQRLTVRALLHMTAGIPHVVRFHWPGEPSDRTWDKRLGHFAAFPPGEQFHYSNQSLGIVGEILARVSRKSFGRYMRDEVFRPLGMTSTAVRVSELPANLVARAYRDKPTRPTWFTRLDPEPGAGMYTSAHDMTTLARRVILNPDDNFLSASVRQNLTDFSQYPFYSAGWWKDPFRLEGTTLLADGAAFGHSASMKVLPVEGFAVAVTVNGAVPDGFTLELCDLLLRAAMDGKTIPTKKEIPEQYLDRPVAGDTSWLGNWSGYVQTPAGKVAIRMSFDSAGMMVGLGDAPLQRVNGSLSQGILEAKIPGELPRSVVAGVPHQLRSNFRKNGDRVSGYVSAATQLAGRPFTVLPFLASLER
ncbi:MAG: serine hydrolase domain-containing protein [Gemmatimonadaceae bacterium]